LAGSQDLGFQGASKEAPLFLMASTGAPDSWRADLA
jgi:hypothetical protein